MKHNPNRLTETDLNRIVKKVIKESNEESLDEGVFSNIKNKYRGLKGMKRGY